MWLKGQNGKKKNTLIIPYLHSKELKLQEEPERSALWGPTYCLAAQRLGVFFIL